MSTSQSTSSHRSYPLSPPPHPNKQETSRQSTHNPRTPQSPNQASTTSSGFSPTSMEGAPRSTGLPTPAHSNQGEGSSKGSFDAVSGTAASMSAEDSTNKRKRDYEDTGDRDLKKIHREERELDIDDLHVNVGKKYLLCRTRHQKRALDDSADLFDILSLNDIAAKVARVLPNGDKNAMRKTYKGKIKYLGLSGRFDVHAVDPLVVDVEDPKQLLKMMMIPEPEWENQFCRGKEIRQGLPSPVRQSLKASLSMAKGVIPKREWDSSVLGDMDGPDKKVAQPAAAAKPTAALQRPTAAAGIPARDSKFEGPRPKRVISKRTYQDSSYEGYGEGYVDDEGGDLGYSSGDGSGQKRRKKNSSMQSNPASGPTRHNSYGPGMVGA